MKWDNDAGVWQYFQVQLVLTTGDNKGTKKLGQMQNYNILHIAIYILHYQKDLKTRPCLILTFPARACTS